MLALDAPITWRSLARIGLGFAGEYALLALIEDAPAALKIATVICAVAGLFILEIEGWLRRQHRHLLAGAIGVVTTIYMGFVWYAVDRVIRDHVREAGLRDIYVAGNALLDREVPAQAGNQNLFDDAALAQWQKDVSEWEESTPKWLEQNLGLAARGRFREVAAMPALCWSPHGADLYACDRRSVFLNRLSIQIRNLSAILEQISVYNQ